MWFYGVMVSTLDFESSDPSSNLGRTCLSVLIWKFHLIQNEQIHVQISACYVFVNTSRIIIFFCCKRAWSGTALKKILPPVRIELTTFRWLELWLWDWRATYCATEAGDADVGHIKLISHDMVTWRTSPYFRKNSGWQVNSSVAEWLALWTLNLAIPVQVSSVLQRVVVQRANVKRCPSVLSFRPCSEFTWVLCVIYGEVLLIWLNIFCDVKVIRSLYEIHCD